MPRPPINRWRRWLSRLAFPVRILITAIGRGRNRPETALFDHYSRRIKRWPIVLREHECRGPASGTKLRRDEAALLTRPVPARATRVALDETGSTLTSQAFADRLRRWEDSGTADLAFVIGGADGLDRSLHDDAALVLSLGTMTWPHLLARALLAEQLYRAQQILSGHPYHRA